MTDYSRKERKDGKRRNSTLYSIAGWMSSWYGWENSEHRTAFGGYFRLDEESGHVEGEIIDCFGSAKIEGLLGENSLSFQKLYLHKAVPQAASGVINYKFEKNSGVWRGGFLTASGSKGRAECNILPVVQDAFDLVVGPVRLK